MRDNLDPRIKTALISINPTTEYPAFHGAPTALGVLRGVSPTVAVWRPYLEGNNIREIALHIAIHQNSVANRISGENDLMGLKQWKFGWVIRCETIDEKQWKSEIALIKATHDRLVAAVSGFDPVKLDQPVGKKTISNAIEFIHGIAEHSLYHTAQMEMTKTLAKWYGIE